MSEAANEDSQQAVVERLEVTKIREKLPDAIQEIVEFRGDTRITVRRESIIEVLRLLRDDADLQYNFFSECLGVDYLDPRNGGFILQKPHRYEVVYNLYSQPDNRTGKGKNTHAIGATVRISANGKTVMRQVTGGRGYLSQADTLITAGVGPAKVVDVDIVWPDGSKSHHAALPTNKRHALQEP